MPDPSTVRRTTSQAKNSNRASDIAYTRLRDRIVDLRLWPGTTVDERTLSAQLGIGRTPIREALLRLGADGLLQVLPRRGFLVPPIGISEIRDLFEARMTVECGIAALAADRATPHELDDLAALIERAERRPAPETLACYLEDDQAIHAFLLALSRNTFLADAARRILRENLRSWRYYFSERPFTKESLVSHRPLLEALRAGDRKAARRAMAEHVEASRVLLRTLF